ncbi:MAG: hemolysin family protein [Eubacteriales bacterium]|jgi:putative hemolysin
MTIIFIPLLIVVLLSFSAFFSGSEIAFAKCNKQRLLMAAESGNNNAKKAIYISNHFTASLSAILAGNELVNISASSAATVLAVTLSPENPSGAQTIAGVIITIALLIFGEIMPKVIFNRNADKMVLFAAKPILFFTKLFTPVVKLSDAMINWLSPLWTPENRDKPSVTREELIILVDECERDDIITRDDGELLRGMVNFSNDDLKIRDIMVARVDIETFDIGEGIESLLNENSYLLRSHSRIPVYRDTPDNLLGILSVKDFMKEVIKSGGIDKLSEESFLNLLSNPLLVFENKSVSSVASQMKLTLEEMAVVIDEFGGITGIVTAEDLIEQIVGEIYDERDNPEQHNILKYTENKDGVEYILRGDITMNDLFTLLRNVYNPKLHGVKTTQTTLSGWITELSGNIPKNGDIVEEEGISATVLKADESRVKLAKITVNSDYLPD